MHVMSWLERRDTHDEDVMPTREQTASEHVHHTLGAAQLVDVVRAHDDAGHGDTANVERTAAKRSSIDSITG